LSAVNSIRRAYKGVSPAVYMRILTSHQRQSEIDLAGQLRDYGRA
ncbi:MAG: hypothetical protein ACI9XK_004964, partial [Granulosicoccus sp.]